MKKYNPKLDSDGDPTGVYECESGKFIKCVDIINEIVSARDWIMPGRPCAEFEIDNCIKELNAIILQLKR